MKRFQVTLVAFLGGALLSVGDAAARNWPWPLNGSVKNNWSNPVNAWSDARGNFQIPGRGGRSRSGEDVDHVQSSSGQWYKIGVSNVTVDENGNVHGAKCAVSRAGADCGG